jgi:hypothetical protein
VPHPADAPPPQDPQQIIDEQARRIAQLEGDLRRSEAERQRLRRKRETERRARGGAARGPSASRPPSRVALARPVLLNKRVGLPYGKITALLRDRFGLRVTRGGLGPRGASRGAAGAADL